MALTSRPENEAQGLLLADFKTLLPEEYENRIHNEQGVIHACDDPAFANAVRAIGKKIFSGRINYRCLLRASRFICKSRVHKIATQNCRDTLQHEGIDIMAVTPMIRPMLGN